MLRLDNSESVLRSRSILAYWRWAKSKYEKRIVLNFVIVLILSEFVSQTCQKKKARMDYLYESIIYICSSLHQLLYTNPEQNSS